MNIQKLLTNHIDIWTAAETEKKSGRGRSSGNAGNVYGIKKLRELILELAVRGKLVPQDPNDEPAGELLKRVQVEKAKLIAEGKIKKEKSLPEIETEECPYQLPHSWKWVPFGVIAQHNSGKTLDNGRNTGALHDYITTSNLYWGCFELANVRQMLIRDEEFEKCSARKGDLLICEGGEAGRAAVWFYEKDICFQNHIHRARFYCEIDPYYAYRFFEKLNATGEINLYRKGVGISNMSGKALASILFPLPPLAEQHRIVAKVDELMALCDQLETQHRNAAEAHEKLVSHLLGTLMQSPVRGELVEPRPSTSSGRTEFEDNWQRIAEHFDTLFITEASIDALKQTLLQLAVMGKLVPQDPNDEPASELLKRIQAEKVKLVAEGKIKSKSPLTPLLQRGGSKATAMAAMSSTAAFESESAPPTPISPISPPLVKGGPGGISEHEMPFELPLGWEWCQLVDICIQITDGTHQTPKYVPIGRPFLSAQNVKPFKFMPSDHKFVSQDDFENLRKNRIPEKGDILLTRVGAMIGEAAIIDVDFEFAFYVSLALLKLSRQSVISPFIVLWLNSPLGTSTSVKNTLGRGVSAGNLNLSLIRNFLIGLPPLAEQHRIVAKVDELMALCDQLKSRISESRQLQQKLADVLVEQAVSQ